MYLQSVEAVRSRDWHSLWNLVARSNDQTYHISTSPTNLYKPSWCILQIFYTIKN